MFYLTTHSTHFIYGYMESDIWLRTILIVRKETRCRHIGYSFRLEARVLLYALSHRQDSTYHGLCYTSRGALDGTRSRSDGYITWRHSVLPDSKNDALLTVFTAVWRWACGVGPPTLLTVFTAVWRWTCGVGHRMAREETCGRRSLAMPVNSKGSFIYISSNRQDIAYHDFCYTSCAALAGTRHSSVGLP